MVGDWALSSNLKLDAGTTQTKDLILGI